MGKSNKFVVPNCTAVAFDGGFIGFQLHELDPTHHEGVIAAQKCHMAKERRLTASFGQSGWVSRIHRDWVFQTIMTSDSGLS